MIFLLGMVIEALAILLIVVPTLVPVAMAFGIDPVHFALFVVAEVGNIPYQRLPVAILPWLVPPLG